MFDARELALELLKEETERDQQVHVGASQFSSPCTFCVAHALLPHVGVKEKGRYWLGGVLGTATHMLFEDRAAKIPGAVIEKKISLGHLPGYGVIKSKPDLYLTREQALIDWKTTDRTKLKFLKEASRSAPEVMEVTALRDARFTFNKYRGQLMSYGRGLTMAGLPVKTVHMVFVCRDGKTDDDVWSWDAPYDPAYAEAVFDRLRRLWEYVQEGKDINELPSHAGCYTCQTEGRA